MFLAYIECGIKELYDDCFAHCQLTCQDMFPICYRMCIPGCVCKPGYIRNNDTWDCIREKDCPKDTGKLIPSKLCFLNYFLNAT